MRPETLVLDQSIPIAGTLEEDLNILQDDSVLPPNEPAYILVKLDQPSLDWLALYYVPDDAKVRDKMLYASTRASLVRGLGASLFSDSIFATSKGDLTPDAYREHQRSQAAPKPLSSREQELTDLRIAENSAATYEGSRARASHVGNPVGFQWSPEAQQAVSQLADGDGHTLVILTINPSTETLELHSSSDLLIEDLPSSLPPSEPCYAILAWPHPAGDPGQKREIVFIYSCPSSSPVKNRMVYASGTGTTFNSTKTLLDSPSVVLAPRRIETSDPKEVDEAFINTELGRTKGRQAWRQAVLSRRLQRSHLRSLVVLVAGDELGMHEASTATPISYCAPSDNLLLVEERKSSVIVATLLLGVIP
ncbi:hypothetical protein NMY22_g4001 [Coprinellus aureogranulatus]|nr:hypothetical protein NMY22_g4001 [Coprinellus aureogranulatus]